MGKATWKISADGRNYAEVKWDGEKIHLRRMSDEARADGFSRLAKEKVKYTSPEIMPEKEEGILEEAKDEYQADAILNTIIFFNIQQDVNREFIVKSAGIKWDDIELPPEPEDAFF